MTTRASLLLLLVLFTAGCTVAPRPGDGSAAVGGESMEAVVKRTFTAYGFELESGQRLSIAPAVMDKLAKAGVDATYFEIDTDFGHSASGADWAAPALKEFLSKLER